MKIFLTGTFGNVGVSTLEELLKRGHQVKCFDIRNSFNEKIFKRYKDKVEVFWGDLRNIEDIKRAVDNEEFDVVVHLAFIIPKLSTTGLESEKAPDIAREINVGGTGNLVKVLKGLPKTPKIIFTSSLHIYGRTQDKEPPRTVFDIPQPVEHYSHHKLQCEEIIKSSGLEWSIFRLAATLPLRLKLDSGMFDVPLNNRMEFVHTKDVGLAIANGVESEEIWRKILHIGGGRDCQLYYGDMTERILSSIGVGMLPEEAFTKIPFPTDWLDTEESQKILKYQTRGLDDYIKEVKELMGYKIYLIKIFKPFIRIGLLLKSKYYKKYMSICLWKRTFRESSQR